MQSRGIGDRLTKEKGRPLRRPFIAREGCLVTPAVAIVLSTLDFDRAVVG